MLASRQLAELLAWCRRARSSEARSGRQRRRLDDDRPADHRGSARGAAWPAGEPLACWWSSPRRTRASTPSHAGLVESLLEPFSTALENDQRLREMAAMRAAAEADKQSLLKRLGRKELTDTVVGADSGLQHVIERVELVARSDAPVLILGETGTGKEVIARMIHTQSPRSSGPFLRVNCGAIRRS